MADRLYAVPLSVVQLASRPDASLAIQLDEAQLRALPAFVPDKWPQWADTSYWDNVERRGAGGGTARAQPFRHGARLSQLLDRDVLDGRGDQVGKVEDAIVDLARQRLSYVVISVEALPDATGPAVLQDRRLVPLPLQVFQPPDAGAPRGDALVLRVSESRLRTLPGFQGGRWPDFNDGRFVAVLRRATDRLLGDFSAAR